MPDKRLNPLERFAWAFLHTLWVGGIWISLLIIFPSVNRTVLAPILVYDVIAQIEPRIVVVILLCTFSQLLLFIKTNNYRLILRSAMGFGLMSVFLLSALFLTLYYFHLLDYRIRSLLYMMIALIGFFLTFLLPPWLQKDL